MANMEKKYLRKVLFWTASESSTESDSSEKKEEALNGYFHAWDNIEKMSSSESETYIAKIALIEDENGNIHKVSPNKFKFVESVTNFDVDGAKKWVEDSLTSYNYIQIAEAKYIREHKERPGAYVFRVRGISVDEKTFSTTFTVRQIAGHFGLADYENFSEFVNGIREGTRSRNP